MNNYPETIPASEYLQKKGILFRETGEQLIMPCQFGDCDKDSRENEAHLYMSKTTGQYHCKKCGAKGNLLTLARHLDGNTDEVVLRPTGIQPVKQTPPQAQFDPALVEKCHQALPPQMRKYLNERGINDEIISHYKLGWGNFYKRDWITIPIPNAAGDFVYLKLRRDPNDTEENNRDKSKFFPIGNKATIYGWDSLKGNKSELVICEGELDRLVLVANGIPAITSTAGVNTFRPEWFDYLKNLEKIHIAFDNDDPGKREAQKLAVALGQRFDNIAIHKITFPSRMTEGKDISDYFLKYEGNPDELLRDLSEFADGKKISKPVSLSQLMNMNLPPIRWFVDKLIPEESITIFSGKPSTYKTWILLHLAIQLAKGEPLFGKFPTIKTKVLFIDEESGWRLLQARLALLLKGEDLPIFFRSSENFKLKKESVAEIIAYCEKEKVGVVMFDSLVRIHTASENDSKEMAAVNELIKQIKIAGIAVIIAHHDRKQVSDDPADNMRGSSEILASLDCQFAIAAKENDITIKQTKLRFEKKAEPFKVAFNREGNAAWFEYMGETTLAVLKRDAAGDMIIFVLEKAEKPLYATEILEKIQETEKPFAESTLNVALVKMTENGDIFRKRGNQGTAYIYSLEPFEEKQVEIPLS
jgi:hypothetical protein